MRIATRYLIIILFVLSSCSKDQSFICNELTIDENQVCFSFFSIKEIRQAISNTTIDAFSLGTSDKIGIFSNRVDGATQNNSQLALTTYLPEKGIAYSSAIGWKLIPGGKYNYFAYYPYSKSNTRDKIIIDFTGQEQTSNDSTEGLRPYNYMYSDMATPVSSDQVQFSLNHICALVNVNITVPKSYNDKTFYSMQLSAKSDIFAETATYSVDDIAFYGCPKYVRQASSVITLSFGDAGIKPDDGIIKAWIMMLPVQWEGMTITAKLSTNKSGSYTLVGTFVPNINLSSGNQYSYSVLSENDRIRCVFIGDSITDFWPDTRPDFFTDNDFIPKGISGQWTSHMLARFNKDVIALNPRSVIILGGVNNIAHVYPNGDIDAILKDIKDMAEMAIDAGIIPIICTICPTGRGYKYLESQIMQANERIIQYAADNELTLVNYHDAMVGQDGYLPNEYSGDGCHPNAAGYAVMEATCRPIIYSVTD